MSSIIQLMTIIERFTELVGKNGRDGKHSWGDISSPSLDYVDYVPDHTEGIGFSQVDNRQWREVASKTEELDWGTIVDDNDQQFDVSASVYPGLSAGQFAQVKKHFEAVHDADQYGDSPFYVRLAYEITSTLQPESLVIVVRTQQRDNPAQPIGYLNIGPADSQTGLRQIGILVLAAFRRKGISRRLFTYVVENSSSLNMKSFWVQYDPRNNDVKNFLRMIEIEFNGKVEVKHDRRDPKEWAAILEIK